MEMFEVGGCIRDEMLGTPSKDIDFAVVLRGSDAHNMQEVEDPYSMMVNRLLDMGVKIFNDKDGIPIGAEFQTARGQAPKDFPNHPGRALDFVLARKEGTYSDGRHPDSVEVGTLLDDLSRRDFTMNAIAKDSAGNLIDPFDGQADIKAKVIRTVGDPIDRFTEDALRAVRALRFSVTKGFFIRPDVMTAMQDDAVLDSIVNKISDERIQQELSKMFRFDSRRSVIQMAKFRDLTAAVFAGGVNLDATMKQKGFN